MKKYLGVQLINTRRGKVPLMIARIGGSLQSQALLRAKLSIGWRVLRVPDDPNARATLLELAQQVGVWQTRFAVKHYSALVPLTGKEEGAYWMTGLFGTMKAAKDCCPEGGALVHVISKATRFGGRWAQPEAPEDDIWGLSES